ncbi:MAG: metallophosphoesterase [Actinomycetota bacterium]|nr:metallophosphoesterase [Actinomycetota bacterium]
MRVLFAADLHQGLISNSRPDPTTGIPSRILDVNRCWQAAVDIAIERQAGVVIVAGDVFHGPNPDATSLNLFWTGLDRLRRENVGVVMIPGNHDRAPHPGQSSVLGIFEDLDAQIVIAAAPGIYGCKDLDVACLPSASRHQLVSGGRTRAAADEDIVDHLRRITDSFRTSSPQVLTGHWPIAGTVIGGEKDIALIPEPMLQPADLDGPWFVGFGHIHKEQGFAAGEAAGAYPGAIDRMNFGEEDRDPSVLEVDVDGKGRATGFIRHPLPATRFVTLDIEQPWDEADLEDAIVRMRGVPESEVQTLRNVAMALGARSVHIEVAREARTAPRAAAITTAPGPLEALDVYLEARGVPEEDRPAIRDEAKQIVEQAS